MNTRQQHYIRILVSLIVGILIAILINEVSFLIMGSGSTRPAKKTQLVIPAGTQQKMEQGQAKSIIPNGINFVIGDELIITNQDSVDHTFGNVFIPKGSSATVVFNQANTFSYQCSFEPKRVLGFEVREPLTTSTRVFGILLAGVPLGVMLYIYSLAAAPVKEKLTNEA